MTLGVSEMDDRIVEDAGGTAPAAARRIPPVAEAFGYVGGALALAAVVALVGTYWTELGVWGRSGIAALLAVVGLAGGFALDRFDEPATKRLAQFLWFIGVAGVGVAVGFVTQDFALNRLSPPMGVAEAAQKATEWAWFTGALGIAVAGGLVYWRSRTWMQHLAFGVGVAAASLLVLPLVPVDGPDWGAGLVLIGVSIAWGAGTFAGWFTPRTEGLGLAAAGLFGGMEIMALVGTSPMHWMLWVGAAVCIALVAAGSRLKEMLVLGIGALGLTIFCGQLIGEYLGFGLIASFALIAVGFALLANAVRMTLAMPEDPAQRSQMKAFLVEVTGYLGVAFALGGGGMLVVQYWEELGVFGRIAVPLVAAVFAYVCALLLERSHVGSARRLSQVLLAIGGITGAVAIAMVARPIAENALGPVKLDQPDRVTTWTVFVGSVAGTVIGAVTWWLRKGSPTQLVFVSMLMGVIVSVWQISGFDAIPPAVPGVVITLLGVVWVSLGAARLLEPSTTAIAAGSYIVLQGVQMMQGGPDGALFHIAPWVGVALALAAIGFSVWLKRGVLLGFGAFGMVAFSIQLITTLFEGQIAAPVMLLAVGVVFIGVAVMVVLLAPRMRHTTLSTP
jgi:hypothetical protein